MTPFSPRGASKLSKEASTSKLATLTQMLLRLLLVAVDEDEDNVHLGYAKGKPFIKTSGLRKLIADADLKDKGLAAIVRGLLEKDPAQRTTPEGVITTLEGIQRGELGVSSYRTPPPPLHRKKMWRTFVFASSPDSRACGSNVPQRMWRKFIFACLRAPGAGCT